MLFTRFALAVTSVLFAPFVCAQGAHSMAILDIDPTSHRLVIGVTNEVPINLFEFKLVDGVGAPIEVTALYGGAAGASGWTLSMHTSRPDLLTGVSPSLIGIPASAIPFPLVELTYSGSPSEICLVAQRLVDLNVLLSPDVDKAPCLTFPTTDCNGNGIPDVSDVAFGLLTDLNQDDIYDQCQTFSAFVGEVSAAAGGEQVWTLDAGPAHGGELYFVLGSETGTSPGFGLQGILVPLVFDSYTMRTLMRPNMPPFMNSLGVLDGDGLATASISAVPGELPASLAGITFYHAFVTVSVNQPGSHVVTSVSNALPLTVMP